MTASAIRSVCQRSLLFVCMWLSVPGAWASVLPGEIRNIVAEYFVFEEGYRDGDWQLAHSQIERIQVLYLRAESRLKDAARTTEHRTLITELRGQLEMLKQAVQAENETLTHTRYVQLQAPVLQVIELFEYKQHPLLYYFVEELDERIEAIEAGEIDFAELLDEAEEMGEALETLETLTTTPVNEASIGIALNLNQQLEEAARQQDADRVMAVLEEMHGLFKHINVR